MGELHEKKTLFSYGSLDLDVGVLPKKKIPFFHWVPWTSIWESCLKRKYFFNWVPWTSIWESCLKRKYFYFIGLPGPR